MNEQQRNHTDSHPSQTLKPPEKLFCLTLNIRFGLRSSAVTSSISEASFSFRITAQRYNQEASRNTFTDLADYLMLQLCYHVSESVLSPLSEGVSRLIQKL